MIAAALIPAAGRGRRMGCGVEKQFMQVAGKPLLAHTLACFEAAPGVDRVVVIVPPGREAYCAEEIVAVEGFRKVSCIVAGAETRQRSVTAGFRCIGENVDVVVIHDGARPFVSPSLIQTSIDLAYQHGSAIVAIPESDTLKRVSVDGTVVETVDRQQLWRAQTPQAFHRSILERALAHAEEHDLDATDEASLVESLSWPIRIVPGTVWNFKITTPDDLRFAKIMLTRCAKEGTPGGPALEQS
jgi:2-C-methyl-D-erythritol 4-phosphate cytidylyltransferase